MSNDHGDYGKSRHLRPRASDAPPATREILVDDESREALSLAAALAEGICRRVLKREQARLDVGLRARNLSSEPPGAAAAASFAGTTGSKRQRQGAEKSHSCS